MLERIFFRRNRNSEIDLPKDNFQKISKAKRILLEVSSRPLSEQVLELSEEDILKSAKELEYPVYEKEIEENLKVHSVILPIFENAITWLLKEEENRTPEYYVFARDCELIYDALYGIAKAGKNNLSERVHYLKTSIGMFEESGKRNPKYFKGMGITKEKIKNGSLVFLDSGFRGSLFRKVSRTVGVKNLEEMRFRGYLMSEGYSHCSCKQIEFHKEIDIKEKIKLQNQMKASPYENWTEIQDFNELLCVFLQRMPKFTGRYVQTYKKQNGKWDVLPEAIKFIRLFGLNVKSNERCPRGEYKYDIRSKSKHYNDSVVDPVASLLLQKATLEYFSNPNVYDRVYSRIGKI